MASIPGLSKTYFLQAMKFLVVLTSVAAFLVKSTNGLYLVKKQEPAPVTSSGIEWIGDGGSREFGNGLLRRAPVENLAPQPAPGPAIVPLSIMRNVISEILQFGQQFLIWMSRVVFTRPR